MVVLLIAISNDWSHLFDYLFTISKFQKSKEILHGVSAQNAQNMENLQKSIEKLGQTLSTNPGSNNTKPTPPVNNPTIGEPTQW